MKLFKNRMCLGFFVKQWYCTFSELCLVICFNHHCSWQHHTTVLSRSFSSNGKWTGCFGEWAGCKRTPIPLLFLSLVMQDASFLTSGECVSKGKYNGSLYVEVSSQVWGEKEGKLTQGVVSSTQGIEALFSLFTVTPNPAFEQHCPWVILFLLPLPSLSLFWALRTCTYEHSWAELQGP